LVAEAIARLRDGEVIKEAGYDGEYGVIRLFHPEELARTGALFDAPAPADTREELPGAPAASTEELPGAPAPADAREELPGAPAASTEELPNALAPADSREELPGAPAPVVAGEVLPGVLLAGLDPGQREAALAAGPLMILAG